MSDSIKASELINVLIKLINEYGDLEVKQDGYYAYGDGYIDGVVYAERYNSFVIDPPQHP